MLLAVTYTHSKLNSRIVKCKEKTNPKMVMPSPRSVQMFNLMFGYFDV